LHSRSGKNWGEDGSIRSSAKRPCDLLPLFRERRRPGAAPRADREGRVVTAEGQATTAEGDDIRTYWFTTVGALAYVQEFGGSLIVRKVLDGTTLLDDGEYSGEEPVGTLADPATFLSEEDLNVFHVHCRRLRPSSGRRRLPPCLPGPR
jgi:hypothetical protein